MHLKYHLCSVGITHAHHSINNNELDFKHLSHNSRTLYIQKTRLKKVLLTCAYQGLTPT